MLNKQFLRRKVHYEETGTCAGRRHGAEPGPDGLRRQHVLSTGTASSAPAGSSSSGAASDAAPAYNPDALQVKALDDNTLQVTLTARTPYFLELTAFPAYAPVQQATVEANGEAWAVDAATYIGNGPYKIAEWVPSSHITMVKNENNGTWTAWLARTPCSSR
jgi:ABC-type transport system substrate-binding protein